MTLLLRAAGYHMVPGGSLDLLECGRNIRSSWGVRWKQFCLKEQTSHYILKQHALGPDHTSVAVTQSYATHFCGNGLHSSKVCKCPETDWGFLLSWHGHPLSDHDFSFTWPWWPPSLLVSMPRWLVVEIIGRFSCPPPPQSCLEKASHFPQSIPETNYFWGNQVGLDQGVWPRV